MNMESEQPSAFAGIARSFWQFTKAWLLILAAVTLSLYLGYVGFAKHAAARGASPSFFDLLYLDWQLFTMESGAVSPPVPWELEVARILAPLTAAFAVLKVFFAIIRERWKLFRIALARDHVIICGLGERGRFLAQDCCARKLRVVAIDMDAEARDRVTVQNPRLLVLAGDATQAETLRRAHVERADTLVAACGDDGVNIEVALRARALLNSYARVQRKHKLNCLVQVMDFTFASLFRGFDSFIDRHDRVDIGIFNSYENAARLLLRDHPLDRRRIRPDDPTRVHLMVFGFGQMGESVVIQAAKVCHFANGQRLRITVFDRYAETRRRAFTVRYPQFAQICDIEFRQCECDDNATLEHVNELSSTPNTLASIVVCFDNDSHNVQFALALRSFLGENDTPIHVRITADTGLANLLSNARNRNFSCFGSVTAGCSWELVRNDTLDRLAKVIHEQYTAKQQARGAPGGPSVEPWEKLSPALRESNRQQADHLPVKLRALGHDVRTPASLPAESVRIDDGMVDCLAAMEHARWNAERFLAGWSMGPKDVEKRRSPYLRPFSELPEEIKDFDRDAVRQIPDLLRAAQAIPE